MADVIPLRIGGHEVAFRESATQVAVAPAPGRARSLESTLRSLGTRKATERRGRLGRFEIVDMRMPEVEAAAGISAPERVQTEPLIASLECILTGHVPRQGS